MIRLEAGKLVLRAIQWFMDQDEVSMEAWREITVPRLLTMVMQCDEYLQDTGVMGLSDAFMLRWAEAMAGGQGQEEEETEMDMDSRHLFDDEKGWVLKLRSEVELAEAVMANTTEETGHASAMLLRELLTLHALLKESNFTLQLSTVSQDSTLPRGFVQWLRSLAMQDYSLVMGFQAEFTEWYRMRYVGFGQYANSCRTQSAVAVSQKSVDFLDPPFADTLEKESELEPHRPLQWRTITQKPELYHARVAFSFWYTIVSRGNRDEVGVHWIHWWHSGRAVQWWNSIFPFNKLLSHQPRLPLWLDWGSRHFVIFQPGTPLVVTTSAFRAAWEWLSRCPGEKKRWEDGGFMFDAGKDPWSVQ